MIDCSAERRARHLLRRPRGRGCPRRGLGDHRAMRAGVQPPRGLRCRAGRRRARAARRTGGRTSTTSSSSGSRGHRLGADQTAAAAPPSRIPPALAMDGVPQRRPHRQLRLRLRHRVGVRRPDRHPRLPTDLPASGARSTSTAATASEQRPLGAVLRDGVRRPADGVAEAFAGRGGSWTAGLEPVGFPVEVRFVAGDDIAAVDRLRPRHRLHRGARVPRARRTSQYFQGVERIMDDYGGRPHWGKLHFQSAATLADATPWDAFQMVRRRLTPAAGSPTPHRSGARTVTHPYLAVLDAIAPARGASPSSSPRSTKPTSGPVNDE